MTTVNTENKKSEGFVYFSFGEDFIDETFVSIFSLIKNNPGAKICLITDVNGAAYVRRQYAHVTIDEIKVVPVETNEGFWAFRLKLNKLSPYDRTVFLDGDTYITGYIRDLFDLTETFDFVAVPDESHPSRGFILGLKGGYKALGYYNCGFFIFRKSSAVDELFKNWIDEYLSIAELEPGDQGPLVRALIKTNVRFITLPKEYNLRLINKCVSFQGRVKIIHGRAKNPEKLARKLNDIKLIDMNSRVWIPHFQTIIKATQFRMFYYVLRLLNLDNVQEASGKKEGPYSQYGKILPFLLKKTRQSAEKFRSNLIGLKNLVTKKSASSVTNAPKTSNAGSRHKHEIAASGGNEVDAKIFEVLMNRHKLRSFFDCGSGDIEMLKYLETRALRVQAIAAQGTPAATKNVIFHDMHNGPYISGEKADLVWYNETSLDISEQDISNVISTITANSSKYILMTYGFYTNDRQNTYYEHHPDAYWTQLISDKGFYFDPYLTLELRKLSNSKAFKKSGLVFEKVEPR